MTTVLKTSRCTWQHKIIGQSDTNHTGSWCNGNTRDFGSLIVGSNPADPTMIYKKQDYKMVINWDINGNLYFELYHKGVRKFMDEKETEFIVKELEDFISKLK